MNCKKNQEHRNIATLSLQLRSYKKYLNFQVLLKLMEIFSLILTEVVETTCSFAVCFWQEKNNYLFGKMTLVPNTQGYHVDYEVEFKRK